MVRYYRKEYPEPVPENDIYIRGKTTSIWLPAATYNQVLAQAKRESRSLSNMIEVLCRRGLKGKPE